VAAYTLPGAVGAIVLRRWLHGRPGTGLVIANAVLRATALGLAGCLALAGLLGPPAYVALLGASSLLTAWGVAGKYTLIADLFPADQRVAGNTVFSLADQLSLMIGPALAGVIAALAGPAIVIVLDAASWALLAISYAGAARFLRAAHTAQPPPDAPSQEPPPPGTPPAATSAPLPSDVPSQEPPPPDAPPAATSAPSPAPPGGWALIRSVPVLGGLLALTFVFYLLYGPLEVALPVHVALDLHGSAALLGLYWAVFGVGAIGGELSAPYLRRWPVWPVMTGIVLAWGLALLPLGLPAPLWAGLAAFFAGGLIFGPWMSLSMGVFQDASPPGTLAQVLAARSSLLILAGPIGIAFGGPLVAALGARGTLLASALATIALGLITTAVLARARTRATRLRAMPTADNLFESRC
jgi:hypothetical protein